MSAAIFVLFGAASAVGNEVNPYATAQAAAAFNEARSKHPETGFFSFTFTGDGCGGQCPTSGCYEEDLNCKSCLASWHSAPPDPSYKYAAIVSGGCSGKKVDCPECQGMMGLSRYTLKTASGPGPVASVCAAPAVKYWALDTPNNECAETCLSTRIQIAEFEAVLTFFKGKAAGNESSPCADHNFHRFKATHVFGAGPLKISMDKYMPDGVAKEILV